MGDAAGKASPAPGPAPAFGTQSSYYNDAAALYADPKIRLHYPPELFERVYAFAGGPVSAALDVGTGTGQCAQQLALKYRQVGPVTLTPALQDLATPLCASTLGASCLC